LNDMPPSTITLTLDGQQVSVPAGATVAAALVNAGIAHCRISVTGEARGPLCAMGVCYECRVSIDEVPHQRACVATCAQDMRVETGRAGAAPGLPRAAAITALGPPRAAGGTVVVRADVAVIGAGPAGVAAACRAAEAGCSVVVLDQAPAPGGQVWRPWLARGGAHSATAPRSATGPASMPANRRAAAWLRRLAASGARLIAGAAVVDALPGAVLLAESAGRALRVEAPRLILATGARELFLPFPGWTLPNVVGVGGAQALLKGGADLRRRRVVVAGSGPLLLPVAAALARAGAEILLVAEQAPTREVFRFAAGLIRRPHLLAQAGRYRAAFWHSRYRCGVWVQAALDHPAGHREHPPAPAWPSGTAAPAGERPPDRSSAVRAVTLTDGTRSWSVECDLLACAYGLVPNLELPRLAGCALDAGAPRRVRVDDLQKSSVPDIWCAGETTGIGGLDLALASGQIAGLAAAGRAPDPRLLRRRDGHRRHAEALQETFRPRAELRRLATAETLVCRCEDVAVGRLDPAWTPRQAKLYTRAGMGPCQGRICGPALEHLFGWDEPDSVRPPLEPLPISAFADLSAAAPQAAPPPRRPGDPS
jgi:NADPH-dependent 2,4-dienoyl-CoA reductase/sulfur reductase-like enzyme